MMPDDKDIDLSEDLFETAAKQLREDIDWEVYSDVLVTNFNWHRVRINPAKAETWECLEWLHRNCAGDRKSTRLNSSHSQQSRMPSSA